MLVSSTNEIRDIRLGACKVMTFLNEESCVYIYEQERSTKQNTSWVSNHRLKARMASTSACQSCSTVPFARGNLLRGRHFRPVLE